MALTTGQQQDIIKAAVATFNASVGVTYMNQLAGYGSNIGQLYIDLANSSGFQGQSFAFSAAATNLQFATAITNQLIGTSGQYVTIANHAAAIEWIQLQLDSLVHRGTVIKAAVDAINSVATSDTNWGNARSLMDNRVTVATDYTITNSGSSTSITTLQGTLSLVTNTAASVTAAIAANAGASGQAYALTTGTDSFTGGAGNDTFNAGEVGGVATWTVGDAINGGGGTDVLNVTQTAAITVPVSATVTNVETANLISGTTGTIVNASSWTGLTALNITGVGAITATGAATTAISVTETNNAAPAVTINGGSTVSATMTSTGSGSTLSIGGTTAAAGAVTVNTTTSMADTGGATTATGAAVTVKGGTSVTVNNTLTTTTSDDAGDALTGGAVSVTGNASTTSVSVTQTAAAARTTSKAAVVNGAVTIADVNAGTATTDIITTVTLANYGNSTIDSTVLNTLSLSGTGGTLGINKTTSDTTGTATTLTLNLAGGTLGAISGTHAADFTTVNVVTTGTTKTTIADVTLAGMTTLNVSGTSAVVLTANTGVGALTAVNAGDGGLSMGTKLGTGVLFTGGAGADSVSLDATTKAIVMGAGNDTVISAGLVGTGGSVNAGDGIDTIVMSGAEADAADNSSVFNSKFTNFEILKITTGATETIDAAGINNVSQVSTIGANGLTINNIASGATLTLTGASTTVTVGIANATFNAADTFNLALSNSTAGVVAFGSVTAANVETVNISTVDAGTSTSTAATIDNATLVATSATKIVVSGNNGLTLTNTGNVAVTTFDASGVVANGTDDTAANLAVTFAVTTTGSKAVTVTGGAGNDVLSGNNVANTVTFTGGEGADILATGLGNDAFILTETVAAVDTVVFLTTASNGVDAITGFQAGAGTTTDKAQLVNAATTAGTGEGVAAFGTSTNTTLTNGAAAFALTGASSTTSDVVEITATLSSFGNLGAAGITNGAELLKALSSTNTAATSITATTANDDFYIAAYQGGNAYLYQVTNGADTDVTAADIALVSVFNGVAAGAFASGDFTVLAAGVDLTINGTAGDDTIAQGASTLNLAVNGLGGNDTITTGTGNDIITTLGGNDTITSGAGNDTITGGAGNDTITADAGDDTITAGAGIDSITGGTGADTFIFQVTANADVDNIADFLVADNDILAFDISSMSLNALDYVAGAVTLIDKATFEALAAGAAANHVIYDTAANIVSMLGAGNEATDNLVAIATNGNIYYSDASGSFATAVIIGTITAGQAAILGAGNVSMVA